MDSCEVGHFIRVEVATVGDAEQLLRGCFDDMHGFGGWQGWRPALVFIPSSCQITDPYAFLLLLSSVLLASRKETYLNH